MPRSTHSFTQKEIELSKQLFADAQALGNLKAARGLGSLFFRGGYQRSLPEITVNHTDYLVDARKRLAKKRLG